MVTPIANKDEVDIFASAIGSGFDGYNINRSSRAG
jgi:hypothetical protein